MRTQILKLSSIILLFISFGLNAQNFQKLNGENPYFEIYQAQDSDAKISPLDQNMECPENSLYGQTTDDLLAGSGGFLSDENTNAFIAQQFLNINGLIGGIKVFCIETNPGNYPCSVDAMNVKLRIYDDNNGLPGEIIYESIQTVEGTLTGDSLPVCDNAPIEEYTITFEQGIDISSGYFSLFSTGENGESGDCCIRIVTIVDGQGDLASNYGDSWSIDQSGLKVSYCLLPLESATDAPGQATTFNVVPDNMGANEALVNWTNPSLTATGNELTELTEVHLYANGVLETTISNPIIGAGESFDFTAPSSGMYVFDVYGVNSQGEGLHTYFETYVGMDVPEAPLNLSVSSDDLNGYVSWNEPLLGLNGGYYDGTITEYQILRYPDMMEIAVAGNITEYLDESIPGVGPYSYSIMAVNSIGNGGISESGVAYLGGGIAPTLVIGEKGTGTWCVYCPGAALAFEDLVLEGYEMGLISYHANDDYEFTDGLERLATYYNVEGYPTAIFDGILTYSGGDPIMSVIEEYRPMVDERLLAKTAITIDVSDASVIGNTLQAEIEIVKVANLINENTVFHAVLTESDIQEEWITQTELNHVARVMFNGVNGTPVDLINNNTLTIPISITIDDSWVEENCELVVFVQDNDSKEILNGNKMSLATVGMEETTVTDFVLYPNPANEKVSIQGLNINEVTIFNMVGQLIEKTEESNINTASYENGLYVFRIKTEDGRTIVKRVEIVH